MKNKKDKNFNEFKQLFFVYGCPNCGEKEGIVEYDDAYRTKDVEYERKYNFTCGWCGKNF